jgi:hypothetical protein
LQLQKEEIPQPDISVREWLQRHGVASEAIELADVCYANDFGTSLEKLGMTEAILEARAWDAGEEYLLKDRSFELLIEYLAREVPFRLSWPVRSIDWHAGSGATVHGVDGQVRALPRVQSFVSDLRACNFPRQSKQ